MGGIGHIAMAAAAASIAAIGYAIFQQVWNLIPWAGSAMLGASWALMFSHIDPILGMGGAIGLGALIYPALQIFTAHTTQRYKNPMAMPTAVNAANSVATSGTIAGAGIVAGVSHLVSRNIPGSLLAGAAAGFLMYKYGSTAMVNFYIEIGFMQKLACGAQGSDPTNCVSACTASVLQKQWQTWQRGSGCDDNPTPEMAQWCGDWKKYLNTCDWKKGERPGAQPPKQGGGNVGTSTACAGYQPYVVNGYPKFEDVCTMTPFSTHYGALREVWHFEGTPVPVDYMERKDPNITMVGPGLGFVPGLEEGQTYTPQHIWGTHGYIDGGQKLTCMYQSNDGSAWQLGNSGMNQKPAEGDVGGKPIQSVPMFNTTNQKTYNYTDFDLSDPKNAAYNKVAGPWRNRKVCAPTYVVDKPDGTKSFQPRLELDTQPLVKDQGQWCGKYNPGAKKPGDYNYARVRYKETAPQQYVYQCQTNRSQSASQPPTPLPFPVK